MDKSGHQLRGWIAYSILLGLAAVCIYGVGKAVEASRGVTKVALIAFFLRLGIGVALTLLLPVFGYQDNAEHHAGYFYTDSYYPRQPGLGAGQLLESHSRLHSPVASQATNMAACLPSVPSFTASSAQMPTAPS